MAKAEVTVIQKTVGTVYAHFGFGRGEPDDGNWRWRQYRISKVSAASALRFECAMNKQAARVNHEQQKQRSI